MANPYPFFGFWVKEFLGDNRVQAMTTEEVGAYLLLLLAAWQEDPVATLPADEDILCRLARMTEPRWQDCRKRVLACFSASRDGKRLEQKRLRKEFERIDALHRKRQMAGKKAAETRWQTHSKGNANALPTQCNTVSESDSKSSEMVGGVGEGKTAPAPGAPYTEVAADLAQQWVFAYRGKVLAERDPYQVAGEFQEWLDKLGVAPAALLQAILDTGRDRTEPTWRLKDRVSRGAPGKPAPPTEPPADRAARIARERAAAEERERTKATGRKLARPKPEQGGGG